MPYMVKEKDPSQVNFKPLIPIKNTPTKTHRDKSGQVARIKALQYYKICRVNGKKTSKIKNLQSLIANKRIVD